MRLIPLILVLFLTWLSPGFVVGAEQAVAPFAEGEKIQYSIRKLGMKAGEATLIFSGKTKVDGKEVVLIVFNASGLNFEDAEKIYVDPKTFLPVRVDRDVNFLGKKEKISEYYDAEKGSVKIVKVAGGKTTEMKIQRKGQLDNLYGFIYRYRRDGQFKLGDSLRMNLPTMDVKIALTDKEQLKAGGKVYESYFMESDPRKYRVWFDAGESKIPLRIDGAVGFGSTSMIMVGHSLDLKEIPRRN